VSVLPGLLFCVGSYVAADGGHHAGRCGGYEQLPVSALPEVDYPIIQVLTFYPGAGPEVMASSGELRLWSASLARCPLEQMTSVSSGAFVITLEFKPRRKHRRGRAGSPAAINAAKRFCPPICPTRPLQQGEPCRRAHHDPGADLDSCPWIRLKTRRHHLAQKISQVTGVGWFLSTAARKITSVRIQANPAQLAAYNLSLKICAPPWPRPTSTRPRAR